MRIRIPNTGALSNWLIILTDRLLEPAKLVGIELEALLDELVGALLPVLRLGEERGLLHAQARHLLLQLADLSLK